MEKADLARKIALCAGALAIAGTGLTAGCSSTKESKSPTGDPTSNSVDSKTNMPPRPEPHRRDN
jgi:hypothetical protein